MLRGIHNRILGFKLDLVALPLHYDMTTHRYPVEVAEDVDEVDEVLGGTDTTASTMLT